MTFGDVRRLAVELPRIVEGTSYGTAAFRVGKKFLGRLKEDGVTLVLRISFDEREILMRSKPKTFFITDHYRDYPAVLVRLGKIREGEMRDLLKRSWEFTTKKKLVTD
ncbi:MAG TPA: MmcQ/YjbR family DNA-binding protein [Thermoanaerobaculia bacterium]|nr:MmcQ/YjbR family DNA-binding protein [Thermoanaerobaculia bacterium]